MNVSRRVNIYGALIRVEGKTSLLSLEVSAAFIRSLELRLCKRLHLVDVS